MWTPRSSTVDEGFTVEESNENSVEVSLASCCHQMRLVGVHPESVASHPRVDALNTGGEALD